MMAVGAAGDRLTLKETAAEHLEAVIAKLRRAGLHISIDGSTIQVIKK